MIMKKQWEEPRILVQEFTPNEYVSACGETETVYRFNCDMPSGDLYVESNGIPGLQRFGFNSDTLLLSDVHGCGQYHEASTLATFEQGYAYQRTGLFSSTTTPVVIWRESGQGDYEIHATTNTNMSSWVITKS